MRPSLIPGLVAAARRNVDRGAASIRLFEVGRRYLADAERPTVGLLLAGERTPRSWQSGKAQDFDRVRRQGRGRWRCSMRRARRSANLQLFMDAGRNLASGPLGDAWAGQEHPRRVRRAASARRQGARRAGRNGRRGNLSRRHPGAAQRPSGPARPITPPALQAVTRDFAFVVPGDLAADALVRAIRGADKAADHRCAAVRPLRRRAGPEPGGRSHAAARREELHRGRDRRRIASKIVAAAEKLGAKLRG